MKATYSIKSLVILGILASYQGYVRSESNCDDNAKLQYEAGKSYVYNLEEVSYDTTKNDWARFDRLSKGEKIWGPRSRGKITVSGKVVLTALESCKFAITLQDVATNIVGERVGDAMDSRDGTVPRTSMLFTFKNGEVSNLHKQAGESTIWTENILRGILTMIQNKGLGSSEGEPVEKETNIKGDCLARIFIPQEGHYKKTILSGQCSDPVITPSEGVPYDTTGHGIDRAHFQHSTSFVRCQNNVTNGLVSEVSCVEMNELPNLRTFRHTGEIQSTFTLEQAAVDSNEVGGVTPEEISALTQATSMNFDSRRAQADGSWESDVLTQAVALSNTMQLDSDLNRAEQYLKLKEILIFVKDFQKLEELIQADSQDDLMKSQFILNMVRNIATEIGTEGAVIYISNLIHNKALDIGPMAVFHTHLHLTKDATFEGLKALNVIVQDTLDEYNKGGILDSINVFSGQKRVIRQQLLGVSAYAYHFCKKTPTCGELPEYQELIGNIAQFAPSKVPDLTHAALQSLGNVPSLPDAAVKVVAEILEQAGSIFNGGGTKLLSAFEAFRRDPCNPTLKQATREIFLATDQSLEVQVSAYMAIARCMDEEDLKTINEVLENTPISPLSSFIASHVHNIMDSQSPSKIPLKTGLLSQISIPESVLTVHNMRNASKFVEYSTFHPDKNLGFSAEATLFFQGNSLPQFIQANWTVDLFGKSYNTFQVGLSKRLVPSMSQSKVASVLNFFDVQYNSLMMELVPMFFGMDSYYRIFGTTVTMGVDAMEALKAHQFFDHRKDPETQMLKFDFVKAFTMLDHDIRVPTISGLPLTFSGQIAYLPMVSASHIGDTNGIGFKDLLTKWDQETGVFAHNSSSDSAFVVGYGVSVGKGTPVHLGYKALARIRVNHSIGFESAMEEGGWLKTIHFPDTTVASVRLTAIRQFFVEHNGHEFQKWNIFGDMMPTAPEQIFKVGGFMGLQASGQWLSRPHSHMQGPIDMLFKVEKTEKQFTGYGLAIEIKDEGENMKKFGVKAMAYGLSTEDTIRLYLNYTDLGVHDIESFDERPSLAVTAYADMTQHLIQPTGFILNFKSTGHKKSVLAEKIDFSEFLAAGILSRLTLGLVVRPEYSLELETINEGDKQKLLDWTIHNGKDDAKMSMKFSGPLEKSAGEVGMTISRKTLYSDDSNSIHVHPRMTVIKGSIQTGEETRVKLSQKSEDLGTNELALGFSADDKESWLNTTVEFQQVTYDLTQHLYIPKVRDTLDGETQKSSTMEVGYTASYKDSNGIKTSTIVEHTQHRNYLGDNQVTDTKNASLRVLSGDDDVEALNVEFSLVHEMDYNNEIVHDELKRRSLNFFVVSYEKKQAELKFDHKYTETGIDDEKDCKVGSVIYRGKDGKSYRCRTHNIMTSLMVPDHVDYISTFDNDQRHSLKKVIKAYLPESKIKFNLAYDLNFPLVRNGMGMESKTDILLENVGGHWKVDSNLDLDLENRTLELISEAKQKESHKEPATWSTSVSGKWENDYVWVGETSLNIRHECPANNVLTVDITNRGNETRLGDSTMFTNVLTAVIDKHGRSKIYNPKKKFTWTSVSDWGLTNDEKALYDFGWKWNSEMKLEKMLDQPEEIFCYKESANLFKMLNQEAWKFKDGQFSLNRGGSEKAAGSWDLTFSIIPEHHDHTEKETELITEVSHNTPTSASSTHIQFMASMDGWFEQDVASPRNHTIHLRHKYDFLPYVTRIMSFTDFFLKTTEVNDGSELFKIDMTAVKDGYYKDLLHFSHFERFNMNIDNMTWALMKDIRVNGPHLAIHIKSDGETDEESWLIDFDGGLFEEKHQHKLNFQGKSGSKADHKKHNHHVNGGILPYTNFNLTVSRRR